MILVYIKIMKTIKTKYTTKEWEIKIRTTCRNSKSMAAACVSLNMNHNTFIKYAKLYRVYNTNQPGKGCKKNKPTIPINDIVLFNLHPRYKTSQLRLRLLKENIFKHKCGNCKLSLWINNVDIPLELHHMDGDNYNNHIDNLTLLCPNCHALTDNYRGKNKNRSNKES